MKACTRLAPPAYTQTGEEHFASCWLYHQKAMPVVNPITEKEVERHG